MKSRSRDGLAVRGLLKFKHKSCFENNTVEKKNNKHVICRLWSFRIDYGAKDRTEDLGHLSLKIFPYNARPKLRCKVSLCATCTFLTEMDTALIQILSLHERSLVSIMDHG